MKTFHIASGNNRTASVPGNSLLNSVSLIACLLVCAIMAASAYAQPERSASGQRTARTENSLIAKRVATLRETRDVLLANAVEPIPRELPADEQNEARRYAAWLRAWASRLDALANKGEGAIGSAGGADGAIGSAAGGGGGQDQLLNATKQMQETQMSFNLQYLQLQSQMQNENRQYTAISNIMKTKHDTVKNSISNIR